MTDLETFRAETRAWLEANCPAECAGRSTTTRTGSGAAATPTFKTPAHKLWLERMARARLDRAGMARGIRRRRAEPRGGQGAGVRNAPHQGPAAAGQLRRLDAGPGAAAVRDRGTEEALPARDRARRDPLVPGLFRARRRLRSGRRSRRAPRTRATTGSSTARRSGPPMPTRPTGSSAWCAPTRRRPSIWASPSCCSTWRRRASRREPITLISRQVALLRDLLRRRAGGEGEPGRHAEPRLGRGQASAGARADHDRRHGRGRRRAAAGPGRDRTRSALDDDGRLDDRMLRARIAELEIDAAAFRLAMERVGRSGEGRAGASGHRLDAEILRLRAEQAAPRAADGGGRLGRAGVGKRALAPRARRRATGCAPRPTRSRAGPARSS